MEGLAHRYGEPLPDEAIERLDTELEVICQMGFPAYFLVVADIVAAREELRFVSGRYALIVANDEYDDPKLRRLRAPSKDAAALARVPACTNRKASER